MAAAIHNADVIVKIQNKFGSFQKWLDHHHPKDIGEWVKLFKKTFKFTGEEITNEFYRFQIHMAGLVWAIPFPF